MLLLRVMGSAPHANYSQARRPGWLVVMVFERLVVTTQQSFSIVDSESCVHLILMPTFAAGGLERSPRFRCYKNPGSCVALWASIAWRLATHEQ
jgi:hypothetical protein